MRVTPAIALAAVLLPAGSAVALAPVLFSGEPPATAQQCTESAGSVSCANGYAGFRGPSGNLWLSKGRRRTVIVSMDDSWQNHEPSWRKQDRRNFTIGLEW